MSYSPCVCSPVCAAVIPWKTPLSTDSSMPQAKLKEQVFWNTQTYSSVLFSNSIVMCVCCVCGPVIYLYVWVCACVWLHAGTNLCVNVCKCVFKCVCTCTNHVFYDYKCAFFPSFWVHESVCGQSVCVCVCVCVDGQLPAIILICQCNSLPSLIFNKAPGELQTSSSELSVCYWLLNKACSVWWAGPGERKQPECSCHESCQFFAN